MKEYFELYDIEDLRLVDVRRYNGIEDGRQSWTFLGYDVIKVDCNGNATSILADKETNYKFLKPIKDGRGFVFYDHSNINIGDIRIKNLDHTNFEIFGKKTVVSKGYIKNWIEKRPDFYFLNYQYKEQDKVKKLGEKK